MRFSVVTELEECERLWNCLVKPRGVSDLWEFRLCFHRHFRCEPYFLIIEDRYGIAGIIPLSSLQCPEMYVVFPGETWNGKTWNERTPLYVRENRFLPELLSVCPEKTYLRYIEVSEGSFPSLLDEDEIGYVLYPVSMDFDLTRYQERIPKKKFKDIMRTIRGLTANGSIFRLNKLEDFDLMVGMTLKRFGPESYFYDDRFTESFRDIMHFLHRRGLLRMVSLEIGGKTAAVDLGAVYNGTYTVFIGGTDNEFPGVAKVMNMYHIEFAFRKRLSKVDFLCGDFHWKKLWHLDPEPLYKFVTPAACPEDGFRNHPTHFLHEARLHA